MVNDSLVNKLLDGNSLSKEQTKTLFERIINGDYDDITLAGLLIAMKIRGETAAEIAGASQGVLSHVKYFDRPNYTFGDIVGTGGDSYNTINVSTTSAIVAATIGAKICKHGNRKVSSTSGSADVLANLGVDLDASAKTSRNLLDKVGLCFLMAPNYHPSIRNVMPVRTALKTRTIFNILGPLINPARPDYIVNGVYSPDLLDMVAKANALSDIKQATVVHGSGLDEVCLHGTTEMIEVKNGAMSRITLSPSDFGLPQQSLDDVVGGTPKENAQVIKNILGGEAPDAHHNIVAANVAVLLRTAGIELDLKKGVDIALNNMYNGKAMDTLYHIQAQNNISISR